ncbi:MAG: DUF2214 family protein [Deltaproteobacteria bacterium]|nr:DUF2214 family protein [Deltaproteobacteria bacterium]
MHLPAFGVGLGAIFARQRGLKQPVDVDAVLRADNWWVAAAILWLASGLARAFGGLEKGTAFYLANNLLWVKMSIYGLASLLELWPMSIFIAWRVRRQRGQPLDLSPAPLLRRISQVEAALVCVIPFVAAAMARGLWMWLSAVSAPTSAASTTPSAR